MDGEKGYELRYIWPQNSFCILKVTALKNHSHPVPLSTHIYHILGHLFRIFLKKGSLLAHAAPITCTHGSLYSGILAVKLAVFCFILIMLFEWSLYTEKSQTSLVSPSNNYKKGLKFWIFGFRNFCDFAISHC